MANYSIQLVAGHKTWANADFQSLGGAGRRAPRLVFGFNMRTTTERISTELHHVRVRVFANDELLGEGVIVGGSASWHGTLCQIEVPVTHRMMQFVTDTLPSNADASLRLQWSGILRVTWRPGDNDPGVVGDPEPDVPTFVNIVEHELNIGVARSDWFGKVLQPMGDNQFVYLEVAVPKGAAGADWRVALNHLEGAEQAYAIGDDPGVFAKLRAAIDALPGAKQNVVDALPEPRRTAINTLLKQVGEYLHHGRHVATVGDSPGEFPVNRIDASAAIALVRVTFSYVSRAISAANASEG